MLSPPHWRYTCSLPIPPHVRVDEFATSPHAEPGASVHPEPACRGTPTTTRRRAGYQCGRNCIQRGRGTGGRGARARRPGQRSHLHQVAGIHNRPPLRATVQGDLPDPVDLPVRIGRIALNRHQYRQVASSQIDNVLARVGRASVKTRRSKPRQLRLRRDSAGLAEGCRVRFDARHGTPPRQHQEALRSCVP